MPTFTPCVFAHHRRKDGTYNVKIKIYHNGRQRYLATSLWARPQDLTRSLKIKSPEILNKAGELVARMRAALSDVNPFDLKAASVDWIAEHIRASMSAETFRLDFFEFADAWITCKAETTRRNYEGALRSLERYLGRRELDVNEITRRLVLDYMEATDAENKLQWSYKEKRLVETSKPKGGGTASRHVMKLAHIFDAARARYNDEDTGRILIPRDPFSRIEYHLPPSEGQKNLGAELMQRIIDAQTDDPLERVALDAFVLSFALMGANFADLYGAVPPRAGVWTYNRQKTRSRRADRAEMRVYIPACVRAQIRRLGGDLEGVWWLPALRDLDADKSVASQRVNRGLARWCRKNGVERFTFYAARHTWATLARKAGVEKALVDECLCHVGDYQLTDIYAERDWDLINEANKKTLALFSWN
jgi:integrase